MTASFDARGLVLNRARTRGVRNSVRRKYGYPPDKQEKAWSANGALVDSTNTTWVDCPYCGTRIEIVIDCTIPSQEYIEDCEVCCRPIVLAVSVNDDETISVDARSEN